MSWFKRHGLARDDNSSSPNTGSGFLPPPGPPPVYTHATEKSHKDGLFADAPEDEYEAAEKWCRMYPLEPPRMLPSDVVERINDLGCKAWGLDFPTSRRFAGRIEEVGEKGRSATVKVQTEQACQDVTILSNLPIMAGCYDIQGKTGIYYEVFIHRMCGFIAVGSACKPYPDWRLPGWNRLSTGLHLDDFRKFYQDPDGGMDYSGGPRNVQDGDIIGWGYEFQTGQVFWTHNGIRLPPAFFGLYAPRHEFDVYAAIGAEGSNNFEVNFGGEPFRWKEASEWQWRSEGHVGRLAYTMPVPSTCAPPPGPDDEPPSYTDIRASRT